MALQPAFQVDVKQTLDVSDEQYRLEKRPQACGESLGGAQGRSA
jgi:hypothetical protein